MQNTLTLDQLRSLPLDRILVSSVAASDGSLTAVGGIDLKFAARPKHLLAFGIANEQTDAPDDSDLVVRASTLSDLAVALIEHTGPKVYGAITPLPETLSNKSYSTDYEPFTWLNDLVEKAILEAEDNRGYLFILGGPDCGKTRWALEWVRASMSRLPDAGVNASGSRLPSLSGWYFARVGDSKHVDEHAALQTLISMSRMRRCQMAANPNLIDNTHSSQNEDPRNYAAAERKLGEAFRKALFEFASTQSNKPSKDNPLILLIDGADEMWGESLQTRYGRTVFPVFFPVKDELPEHCFIIITSRPGTHLSIDDAKVKPLLWHPITPADVEANVRKAVQAQARAFSLDTKDNQQVLDPELCSIVASKDFEDKVVAATQASFGYVPLLFRYLLNLDDANKVQQVKAWANGNAQLPDGAYELRVRMLLNWVDYLEVQNKIDPSFANGETLIIVLALIASLRQNLTSTDLLEILVPRNRLIANQIQEALEQDRFPFNEKAINQVIAIAYASIGGRLTANNISTLAFDHTAMREVAIAAWRVWCKQRKLLRLTDINAIINEAKSPQLQKYDAPIHAALALGCSLGWPAKDQYKPVIQPKEKVNEVYQGYRVVWGCWHALWQESLRHKAGFISTENSQDLANTACDLLLHAGHLQSVFRLNPQKAMEILSEQYLLAEKTDPSSAAYWKRIRVEAALLQDAEHLANKRGILHVGAHLHNLLGSWDQANGEARQWKESIDQRALLIHPPGIPTGLLRTIQGYSHCAVSPCGDWMLGYGSGQLMLWRMNDGWHRAIEVMAPLQGSFRCAQVVAINSQIVIAAAQNTDIHLFLVDPVLGRLIGACAYLGHTAEINSVALQVHSVGNATTVLVASGGEDGHVGLLVEDLTSLRQPQQIQPPEKLRLYPGHRGLILSVALQVHNMDNATTVLVASGSLDKHVGLLIEDLAGLRQPQQIQPPKKLRLYPGHTGEISSVALQVHSVGNDTTVLVASGGWDKHIGLLVLDFARLIDPQQIQPHENHRLYPGHTGDISSVALQVHSVGNATTVLVTSGGEDQYVGLLVEDLASLRQPQLFQPPNVGLLVEDLTSLRQLQLFQPPKKLRLYPGHTDRIVSVALQVHGEGNATKVLVASGGWDRHVGLLVEDLASLRQPQLFQLPEKLRLYPGHTDRIGSLALQVRGEGNATKVLVASTSGIEHVGLLVEDLESLLHPLQIQPLEELRLYPGHRSWIYSMAIQVHNEGDATTVLVASSGTDKQVGLLVEDLASLLDPQQIQSPEKLGLYPRHKVKIDSVAIQVQNMCKATKLLIASASKKPGRVAIVKGNLPVLNESLGIINKVQGSPLSWRGETKIIPWGADSPHAEYAVIQPNVISFGRISIGHPYAPELLCRHNLPDVRVFDLAAANSATIVVAGEKNNDMVLFILELIDPGVKILP